VRRGGQLPAGGYHAVGLDRGSRVAALGIAEGVSLNDQQMLALSTRLMEGTAEPLCKFPNPNKSSRRSEAEAARWDREKRMLEEALRKARE
jgi:hypothetical protein